MTPNKFSQQSSKLTVNGQLSADPLLHFYGEACSHKNAKAGVALPLKILAQSANYHEYWSDGGVVIEHELNGVVHGQILQSDNHLVVVFDLDEDNLHDLVVNCYLAAYQASADKDYPNLLRTWNYIDRINEIEHQEERYQTFCVARHAALVQLDQLDLPLPAATAIGGHQGKNLFVFLFAKQAGRVIENKRQVSAWNYPKQYAPKQPRFSRAMQCGSLLMCSGTASVLGHETIHLNDVAAQFDECMKNVSVLLSASDNPCKINHGLYRFYLREVEHVALIETKILSMGIAHYLILHSDVCRENLLIECEVVFQ